MQQELKALLDPESSIITEFSDDEKSEDSDLWHMALDLLLHVLVLHHVVQLLN